MLPSSNWHGIAARACTLTHAHARTRTFSPRTDTTHALTGLVSRSNPRRHRCAHHHHLRHACPLCCINHSQVGHAVCLDGCLLTAVVHKVGQWRCPFFLKRKERESKKEREVSAEKKKIRHAIYYYDCRTSAPNQNNISKRSECGAQPRAHGQVNGQSCNESAATVWRRDRRAHNCFMHTPQQHLPYSDNNSFSSFQQVFVCRWFECISLSEHNLPARVAFRAYQGDNGR